jgi:hypothetical protein
VYSTLTLGRPPCQSGLGNEPPATGAFLTASAQTVAVFLFNEDFTKLWITKLFSQQADFTCGSKKMILLSMIL